MRTFDHPNYQFGFTCPICKSSADQPVTLWAIPGTEEDGIVKAEQVHAECAELVTKMHSLSQERQK